MKVHTPLQQATTITIRTSLKALHFRLWDKASKTFVSFQEIKPLDKEDAVHRKVNLVFKKKNSKNHSLLNGFFVCISIKIKVKRGCLLMKKWLHVFPKSTGLRPYVWIIFCILPFYFLFQSSSKLLIAIGIAMILLFFIAYGLAFASKGWRVYFWFSDTNLDFNCHDLFLWLYLFFIIPSIIYREY